MKLRYNNFVSIGSTNCKSILLNKAFIQKIYEKKIPPKKLSLYLQYTPSESNFCKFKGICFPVKVYGPASNQKKSKVENQVFLSVYAIHNLLDIDHAARNASLEEYYISFIRNNYYPEQLDASLEEKFEQTKHDIIFHFKESTEPIILMRHCDKLESEVVGDQAEYNGFTLGYQPKHIEGDVTTPSQKPWVLTLEKLRFRSYGFIPADEVNTANMQKITTIRLSTDEFYQFMDVIKRTVDEWSNNFFQLNKKSIQ